MDVPPLHPKTLKVCVIKMSLTLLATTAPSALPKNPLRGRRSLNVEPSSVCKVVGGKRVAYTSCAQKQNEEGGDRGGYVMDRRNVLLGLGGLYGAASTQGNQGMTAMADPVPAPNMLKCNPAIDWSTGENVPCCPPYSEKQLNNVKEFTLPTDETLRMRKPAQYMMDLGNEDLLNKFKDALGQLKALPVTDPWNFMNYSKVHCAYCDNAYDQGSSVIPIQVHSSWLFFPWHRFYLYFLERKLAKLIGTDGKLDPTFALPFWNWDHPDGMRMPIAYGQTSSPLYNDYRNMDHSNIKQSNPVMDYMYVQGQPNPSDEDCVIQSNLTTIQSMFEETIDSPPQFMGKPIVAGEEPDKKDEMAAGRLEHIHNTVHDWTGTVVSPNYDMGNLYTAARDPIFFAHHANCDRMWDIYRSKRKEAGYETDFNCNDWNNIEFIFLDENDDLVKCKVSQCLDSSLLRYGYEEVDRPWEKITPPSSSHIALKTIRAGHPSSVEVPEFKSQALTKPVKAIVKRSKLSRKDDEKKKAPEVLIIKGIELRHSKSARFDVYVSKATEDGKAGPHKGLLAGSFVNLPHSHDHNHKLNLELGITRLIEKLHADATVQLVVTIVPRLGEVTVGGIQLKLSEHPDNFCVDPKP